MQAFLQTTGGDAEMWEFTVPFSGSITEAACLGRYSFQRGGRKCGYYLKKSTIISTVLI